MRHYDRGPDFVQQFSAALAPRRMGELNARDIRSTLRCDQLRQVRRADFARAGPLIVELRKSEAARIGTLGALWREHCRDLIERDVLLRERAIEIRMERRAAMAGAIDNVHLVAFLHQQRGPAWAAVGRTHPIRALAAAAVHQHDGIRMPDARGNLILDVHLLAVDHGAARDFGPLHANPEEAPFGQIERRFTGHGCGSSLGCKRSPGSQGAENRQRARSPSGKIAAGKLIV